MKRIVLLTSLLIIASVIGWHASAPAVSTKAIPHEPSTVPVTATAPPARLNAAQESTLTSAESSSAPASHSLPEKVVRCQELIAQGTDEAMQAWSDLVHAEPDEITRLHMAATLDALSTENGLELVTSVLTFSHDETVLQAVNRTINRMANADTVTFLAELIEAPEVRPGQRERALAALAGIENPIAIDALGATVLNHSSSAVREAAARSLAQIPRVEAASALIHAFREVPAERLIERSTLLHHLSHMPADITAPLFQQSDDATLIGLASSVSSR